MSSATTTGGDQLLGPFDMPRPGIGWAVFAFALVAALIALRAAANLHVPGHPGLAHYGLVDFRDAIYYPAVALLDGVNPYDPIAYAHIYPVRSTFALYGPHTLLVHLPFALLPPVAAAAAYFASTLAVTLLLAWLILRLCGRRTAAAAVLTLAALLLLSRPGQSNLFLGQYAATMAVAVALALRPGLAAWTAALGIALAWMKPTFGAPLAVLLLARGEWRAVLAGSAVAALASALPLGAIIAHGGVDAPLALLTGNATIFAAQPLFGTASSVTRIDAASLVGRLAGAPSLTLELALAALLVGGGAWTVTRAARAGTLRARRYADAVICLTILVPVYHQAYDALLLALPLAALILTAPRVADGRRLHVLLLGLLALPLVNYASSFAVVERFAIDGWAWTALTAINAAAILAAWGIVVALTLREARP